MAILGKMMALKIEGDLIFLKLRLFLECKESGLHFRIYKCQWFTKMHWIPALNALSETAGV